MSCEEGEETASSEVKCCAVFGSSVIPAVNICHVSNDLCYWCRTLKWWEVMSILLKMRTSGEVIAQGNTLAMFFIILSVVISTPLEAPNMQKLQLKNELNLNQDCKKI